MMVLAFALPVILVDECLKMVGRIMNKRALEQRLK